MRYFNKAMLVASAALCLNLSVFSQNITLKTGSVTVKEAMEQLKKSSGYSFVFSSEDLAAKDVEEYFQKINYTLKPGDIVFLRTDADDRWGKPEYLVAGAGMSYEATMWLLERGVRVVGTDGWSWDVPLPFEGEEFEKNHDASIIWEAHRVGRDKAYCHIEKLTNLDQLPVTGFKVSCFPVSIKAASAGWARVVAFVE